MRRTALRLLVLVVPVVLGLVIGLAGCGEDHHRHDRGETVVIEHDRR